MSKWGRAGVASLDAGAAVPGRLGRRSLVCAAVAFTVAAAAFAIFGLVGDSWPAFVEDIATVAFMVMFLVVAPAIHVFGFVCGLVAMFKAGDSRMAGFFGALLNLTLLLAGAGLVYFAMRGMAAFT